MLKFNASEFYRVSSALRAGEAVIEHMGKSDANFDKALITAKNKKTLLKNMRVLSAALTVLGAKVTLVSVQELASSLRKTRSTYKDFITGLAHLRSTLRGELSLVNVLVLEEGKSEYFDPKEPLFGKEFESEFPSAVFEIDEAGKCYALSRDTATVFHLMRAMEIAIRAAARCLNIPDPTKPHERNWGHILKKIKEEIDARNTAKNWANATDRQFFESMYVSLDAVRVAWRNTTMHVENKYSPDESQHIFGSVQGFMKKLASRMDESGQPLA